MKYKKIVVAGGGVLGSQIAFQTAFCGFDVTIWLRSEKSIEKTKVKIDGLKETYINEINAMSKKEKWCAGISSDEKNFDSKKALKQVEDAYKNLKYETDLSAALKDADLVIESVSEMKDVKIDFYNKIKDILEEKTVLVTNSSTMLPSTFAKFTGRSNKYLALHFANSIWKNNTAEVMMHSETEEKYFNEVIDFASKINMVALPIKNEKSGYLLNSMLVPFLLSGLDLYVNGISDPVSIDTAWKRGTGAPNGPFEIIDVVGLETAYNIVEQYQKVPTLLNPLLKKMMMPYNYKEMKRVLKEYMDAGKDGKVSGEGFYKYDKEK